MKPETEVELAELLQGAASPVRIKGGGTRGAFGRVTGETLDTGGLRGVSLYEPGALTLVAQAGTPVAEIEAVLAERNQRLAFEPMDHRGVTGAMGAPTIGGVVAANVSGPRRIQVGAARDFLLGVRFVDGAGRVVRNGGRVMKNVTGYDLVKLMAGSWGTLGVLSEVSLKVLAVPQAEATLVLSGQDARAGVADLCRAMGTPFDVSGAVWIGPGVVGEEAEQRIRVEGLRGSVAYRIARLAEAVPGPHRIVEGEESAALWRQVRDVVPFAGGDAPLWRICVRPTDAPALLASLQGAGVAHRAICDWAGGLIWLSLAGTSARSDVVRSEVSALRGHATLVRAPSAERAAVAMFHPQSAPLERIAAGLRARFDPKGILNPRLMDPA
ncbi:FAD-binding protein [Pseudooceanicola sediminis]|uniref:FAD-binding protein n=1 Tax=Pseudooceanicola sediminis TaxID=2211117 RepID=A0A399J428_9RHOB|nr:FAD-binding protein [Pseudooceanicola sediminis]KAA2315648.1 FAD-binding protein [Puniceibacterium sp. HSS470]RII40153.1 FAD-binding protein [Pseudooceanicola sediminis]